MAFKLAHLNLVNYLTGRLCRITVIDSNGFTVLSRGTRINELKDALASARVAEIHVYDRLGQYLGNADIDTQLEPTETVKKITDNEVMKKKILASWVTASNGMFKPKNALAQLSECEDY